MKTLSYPLIAFGVGSLIYLQVLPNIPTGTHSEWHPIPLFISAATLTLGLLILVCSMHPAEDIQY